MNGHHHDKGNHHGFGQGKHGESEGGFCICPECMYIVNHKSGVPCKEMKCPECKISMLRSEKPGLKSGLQNNIVKDLYFHIPESKVQYPKVKPEKCTACGACIDLCRKKSIVWKDGNAFVEIENCSNCKVCIRACPENAFILE
jgi:Pyruvate/2-oxoacid:ferredoxin oxidoreductase delta subunit